MPTACHQPEYGRVQFKTPITLLADHTYRFLISLTSDKDISGQLLDLCADMALDSLKLIPEDLDEKTRRAGDHPSIRNAQSKLELFTHMAEKSKDKVRADALGERVHTAFEAAHIR